MEMQNEKDDGNLQGHEKSPPFMRELLNVPDEIRTHDLQLRRLSLYPAELLGHVLIIR